MCDNWGESNIKCISDFVSPENEWQRIVSTVWHRFYELRNNLFPNLLI